jgi:hypothetical protein
MRKSQCVALLGLFLAIGARSAYADTITTGNLSFALFGAPSPSSPLPTAGSFAYDNTTNQFLSFTATWDGMTFDFAFGATQTNYLALIDSIASPVTWSGICIPSTVNPTVPCDGTFGFSLFAGTFLAGQPPSGPLTPTVDFAEASGTLTVTQVVTTREPGSADLLLSGIGFALVMRKRKRTTQVC